MKERVFYVINLDKQRIGILSLFLFALFFSFFFLGVSVGKGNQVNVDTAHLPVIPQPGSPEVTSGESTTHEEESIPAPLITELSPKTTKGKQTTVVSNALEIPMTDVGTTSNLRYAESSTAKDEDEEKSKQVIDLTKPIISPKRTEQKRKAIAFRNQNPVKSKYTNKREVRSNGPLYTIQLGAFGTRETAESIVSKVNENKPKSKAFIVYKNGLFVVQMGKSTNRDGLKKQIGKLNSDVRGKALVVSFIPLSK